ncbi:unnamed protein product [Discosporangium mesarthrocarpum]
MEGEDRWVMQDGEEDLGRMGVEIKKGDVPLPLMGSLNRIGSERGRWKRGRQEEEEWVNLVSKRMRSKVVGGVPRGQPGGEDPPEETISGLKSHPPEGMGRDAVEGGQVINGNEAPAVLDEMDKIVSHRADQALRGFRVGAGSRLEFGEKNEEELRQRVLDALGMSKKQGRVPPEVGGSSVSLRGKTGEGRPNTQ